MREWRLGLFRDRFAVVTNAGAAFPTIAWKTLRVSHSAQRPFPIYIKRNYSFGIRKRAFD